MLVIVLLCKMRQRITGIEKNATIVMVKWTVSKVEFSIVRFPSFRAVLGSLYSFLRCSSPTLCFWHASHLHCSLQSKYYSRPKSTCPPCCVNHTLPRLLIEARGYPRRYGNERPQPRWSKWPFPPHHALNTRAPCSYANSGLFCPRHIRQCRIECGQRRWWGF